MARPKEFNRDEALSAAMNVFWAQGYEATSMSDLQREMGIGRQSLYDTFGDKEQVFQEAFDRYARMSHKMAERLLVPERGLDAIVDYFEASIAGLTSGPRNGCLIFNTCMEMGMEDPRVLKQVCSALKQQQRGFLRCLQAASETGTLRCDTKPETLALFLSAQIGGLAALSKTGASAQQLRAAAQVAWSALT